MRSKLLAVSTVVVAMLVFGITTAALAGGSDHYGPYPSGSPDSGTCGNFWAEDTFDRHYRVDSTPNEDGTFTVREDFKDGTFVTNAGPSPGACETNPGGVVP